MKILNNLGSEQATPYSQTFKRKGSRRRAISIINVLLTCLIILSSSYIPVAAAQPVQDIYEHVVYPDLEQADGTMKYFKFRVGARYYTGTQFMTVKATADTYRSDPDVFISKTNPYPTSSSDASWYCVREGSETCVIEPASFDVGDMFYIGVHCTRACHYKLRVWYGNLIDLPESAENERTLMRFDADSTQLLRYYIPSAIKRWKTDSIEIRIEPEDKHTPIEVYFSLDPDFYLIEEQPANHIIDNGIGIKFGKGDYAWCVQCYVYVIVNVFTDQRYYITSNAVPEDATFTEKVDLEVMANPFQQQCWQYFVLRNKEDLRLDIRGYVGNADIYLSAKDAPTDPLDSRIVVRAAPGEDRAIILSVADREYFGYRTGIYYLCFYAHTPYSALIQANEAVMNDRFDYDDGQVLTRNVGPKGYSYGRYYNSAFGRRATINVYAEAQDVPLGGAGPPKIFYRMCQQQNITECALSASEAVGAAASMTEVGTVINSQTRQGSFQHEPSSCPDPQMCTYLIAFANQESAFNTLSFRVRATFDDPGDVLLTKAYRNIVEYGQSLTYEINPITNADLQPFISKLSIKLLSVQGDADLFLSFSNANPDVENHDYASRLNDPIDEISLVELGGEVGTWLNRPIFFSVYGASRAQIEITFEYVMRPTFNVKLQAARAIGDNRNQYDVFYDEYAEGFYSFTPWWSGRENRTIVFLSDTIFNKVFFYSQWEAYPKHFLTTKHDANDIVSYYGDDADYHNDGTYYIRLRPDFALYDLISKREYMFKMYTFSMAPASYDSKLAAYETLELGNDYLGFSNHSRYQDYRYFQVDMKKPIYDITVTRVPGLGKPIFYVKIMDSDLQPPARANNKHFESEATTDNGSTQSWTLTQDQITSRQPRCVDFKTSLQGNGRQRCFISIAVKCADDSHCAWKLVIEQRGVASQQILPSRATLLSSTPGPGLQRAPPGPILQGEYTNGKVFMGQIKYYFFPVDYETMGESMILLNKTQIFSTGANGDSKLSLNIQADILDPVVGFNYATWRYPADQLSDAVSSTGKNTMPEIIEPWQERMAASCQGKRGCALIVGVSGLGPAMSSFRLTGFYGQNKLLLDTPVKNSQQFVQYKDHYMHYFWFVIRDAALAGNSRANFHYQVSVATQLKSDPDLYVSLMDGRYPTIDDYDIASTMTGADSLEISSDLSIWAERGWDPAAGIPVVVGVKIDSQDVPYTLILNSYASLSKLAIRRIDIGKAFDVDIPAEATTQNGARALTVEHVFRLYNWEHRNIKINLQMKEGSGNIMYQRAGQKDFTNNIFTALPINEDNSLGYHSVATAGSVSIPIAGNLCYNCWYFIKVQITKPAKTSYSLSVSRVAENGDSFVQIPKGTPIQIYVAAGFSQRRKFLLEATDNWELVAQVATGSVDIYVGLNPGTIGADDYIWKTSSQGGIASLSIRTSDTNFNMGTFYYVSVTASSATDALINLTLKQQRSVEFVPNNHDYTFYLTRAPFDRSLLFQKYQFQTVNSQVKFHIFQVPRAYRNNAGAIESVYFQVKITIKSLSPNFYPQLYLQKIGFNSRPQVLSLLDYPSINSYELEFAGNPIEQITTPDGNRDQVEREFTFTGVSTQIWTYYTMALYQYTWGLTDIRKSEFEMRIEADEVDKSFAIDQMNKASVQDPKNGQRPVVRESNENIDVLSSENEFIREDQEQTIRNSQQEKITLFQ